MGTFFSWVLLILAVLVTLYALGQLVLLRGMKLIGTVVINLEVLAMVGFPAVALVIAPVAIAVADRSPLSTGIITIGYVVLALGILSQFKPLRNVRDKNREHAEQVERAVSAFNSKVDDRWASKR